MNENHRRRFSCREVYDILYLALRSAGDFAKGKKNSAVDESFTERLMLAVTGVNDCPLCSFAHTGMALKAGLSRQEIRAALLGDFSACPPDETEGILFAQHYAESRGRPLRAAWDRVVTVYGRPAALAILGAIRMISAGNALGIPAGALGRRLRGRPAKGSSVYYETGILLFACAAFPAALLHAALAALLKVPHVRTR